MCKFRKSKQELIPTKENYIGDEFLVIFTRPFIQSLVPRESVRNISYEEAAQQPREHIGWLELEGKGKCWYVRNSCPNYRNLGELVYEPPTELSDTYLQNRLLSCVWNPLMFD